MRILVTGGTGYIGSVTVKQLQQAGQDVVVFDNLQYGHRNAVFAPVIVGDLNNKDALFTLLQDYSFDAVVHFAGYALAGESMHNPYKYFSSNLQGGLNLLEFMKEKQIPHIIFSSSCSIYGKPQTLPVDENHTKRPESIYGESKNMFEEILAWYSKLYPITYGNLRYFNAAGATHDASLGEDHTPETHLIPLAITAAFENKPFTIFGNTYNTPDRTCIRDYIHVEDLADAHILALDYVQKTKQNNSFNLGTGNGYSNLEVVTMIKKITGSNFPIIYDNPRPGDPGAIYADSTKAKQLLGFTPMYSDLETIISTAYTWHKRKK